MTEISYVAIDSIIRLLPDSKLDFNTGNSVTADLLHDEAGFGRNWLPGCESPGPPQVMV